MSRTQRHPGYNIPSSTASRPHKRRRTVHSRGHEGYLGEIHTTRSASVVQRVKRNTHKAQRQYARAIINRSIEGA